jgi:hypothetical protein
VIAITAPDGQVYTTSGMKTAIIPNSVGCDSTITIDLTIKEAQIIAFQNLYVIATLLLMDKFTQPQE